MCTVSFINNNGNIIITSNRDEKVIRPCAIAPVNYQLNGKNLLYPKDLKAGGTWFAIDEKGTVLVLLNGGRTNHLSKIANGKSRGLIALDIISDKSPRNYWNHVHLEDIEPFTLVLYQNEELYELIWDGFIKFATRLNPINNHIWSSVTLYSEEIRKKRAGWFFDFLKNKKEISPLEILNFHRNTERGNSENGLIINRGNVLKTLSITQAILEDNRGILRYFDLSKTQSHLSTFIRI